MVLLPLSGVEEQQSLPVARGFRVCPNPVDGQAIVRYDLTRESRVDARVFDAGGRLVTKLVDAEQTPGSHSVAWNSSAAPSGVYYCTIQTGNSTNTQTLVVRH